MQSDIYEVIEEMIEESGKKKKTIAAEMGKEYSAFKRETNQYDSGAKFGAEMILPLMKATGSVAILHYLAHFMGYRLERLDSIPDKLTVPEEMLDSYQSLVAYHNGMQNECDLTEAGRLLAEHVNECEQDFVAYRNELNKRKPVAVQEIGRAVQQ